MKRLLQALALVQLLLVIGLAARIFTVWTTPLPEFGEIPELPAATPLPPPKAPPRVSEAITDAVVDNDLFDEARGQNKIEEFEVPLSAPVPPPSTVKLMGVMLIGKEPVAIVLDTSVKPEQQSVRKGDMFGEYEVGDITGAGLTLLGSADQKFQIPLRVEAAASGGGGAPVPPPRAPGAPAAAARPGAPGKPVSARPAPPRNDAEASDSKAMSARERAQAIAQRNAELRKNAAKGGNAEGRESNKPDPVQARLEALRQLREAAKGGQ